MMSKQETFYEKYIRKPDPVQPQTIRKNRHTENNRGRKQQAETRIDNGKNRFEHCSARVRSSAQTRLYRRPYNSGKPVFSTLTPEAKKILAHFHDILDRVLPLDSKKKNFLPQHIHRLFHELTDERSCRKAHYLNNPVKLSAYAYYYVWWNLVRLTKLLQNIDLSLDDGDYAADLGSGPLTFVCALWIAKPELRTKRLTWYCVDISNRALHFGEELFLALCAYTGRTVSAEETPWQIKKVCGHFGTSLTEKVSLVTEANMFNEIFWNSPLSLEEQAEKAERVIVQYIKPHGSVLLIEPGIPLAGEFLSLMRTLFLQKGFSINAPCPHNGICCFPNSKQRNGTAERPVAYNKWCHFTFETDDSPKNLLHLSEAAKLGKERASLSFLFCSVHSAGTVGQERHVIPVRICSDIIMPAPQTIGRYACSEKGFMLITSPLHKKSILNTAVSGALLMLPADDIKLHDRDKKTNALLVQLRSSL